jgi:hypothetical protein
MRALFGCGLQLRQQRLEGPNLTQQDFQNASRLGGAVQDRRPQSHPVPARGGQGHAAINTAIGGPHDASIAAADRARVNTGLRRAEALAFALVRN